MDGKKVYQIQINGISESVNAVESLNKQLNALENRIKTLEKNNGGSSSLKEQVTIQKELNKLKKEEAAQQRLTANEYSNTMKGMKQHLADLKAVINTTDLGDNSKIKQMTQDANELTNKLKKMEEAYGQFGRNVGNYANSIAEGLGKVKINVGDTVREFDNAKQASKTLGNELKTLAVNGQQGTKEFKDLQKAVAQLNSDIKDATVSSRAMDNLLDTMQSFAAIGSVTQGFSALFGFDDTEIEKSIQKLVALQNVMQGIEKINQQMNSAEGIGGWISKGNAAIDTLVAKLTGANKAQEALNASTTAGATASKSLAAAETAQATATAGATVATKALSLALKTIGIGLIISAVAYLITYWKEIYKWFTDTIPALKNLSTWFDKVRAVAMGVGSAIVNYMVQPLATLVKTIQAIINGDFKDIPNIIGNGLKKTFDIAGNYQKGYHKEIERQQEVHNKKVRENQKKANEELLKDEEAKYGQSHKRTQEYLKKQMALTEKGSAEYKELQRRLWEDERKEREENQKKSLASARKNAKKNEEIDNTLLQLELRLMQEGLNKKLRQLDEEERQTINKLQENGRKTSAEIEKIQRSYAALRIKEIKDYLNTLEDTIRQTAQDIKNIEFDINTKQINNTIGLLSNRKNALEALGLTESSLQPLTSSRDLGYKVEDQLSSSFNMRYDMTSKFYDDLIKLLITYQRDEQALVDENINEEERKQREAENNRFSLLMSGLTQQEKVLNDTIANFKATNEEEKNSLYELKADLVEVQAQIETAKKQHKERLQQITEASNNAIKKNELDTTKEISSIQEKYYNLQLSNYRDFLSKLNDEVNQNPVTSKGFGIVNIGQTKKNYKEIINASEKALDSIKLEKQKLDNDLKEGLISDEAFGATKRQLEDLEKQIKQGMAVTQEASKNLIADFISSTQMYLQAAMNSFNTIMNAIWDAQDVAFDKEQEQIDKENDAIEEALDRQQEIIEKHKSAIDSIEDELATARGDRRQHLIDQLNAEMQAQREAQKEEQKIQKQKEAQQKKQDELELQRKKAQYKRDMLQAIVNGAMAVTMAAINSWPIPAIPMMALAATTTAAQIAIMASNKPYANGGQLDGGVAQGKRHRDGGIPVLGGRASIEGGEFITNRVTTAKNVDLLEYINSKKKKVDINDLIEFYEGGSVKKTIRSVRTKFEDGGYIPTFPNVYDIRDQLQNIVVNQDNRPIYVSVVDINNKQEDVRRVQTLAGL